MDRFLCFFFIAALTSPWCIHWFYLQEKDVDFPTYSSNEGFEFSFKPEMRSTLSALRARYFGFTGESVVVGSDDWLFYRGDDIFEDLLGLVQFDVREWYRPYEEKSELCERYGADYFLVTIPNKSSVCTEKLPALLARFVGDTRYDEIIGYEPESLKVLHLFDKAQRFHASGRESYWFDDTHWSSPLYAESLESIFSFLANESGLRYDGLFSERVEHRSFVDSGDLSHIAQIAQFWPQKEKLGLVYTPPSDSILQATSLSFLPEFEALEPDVLRPIAIGRESGSKSIMVFHDSFLVIAREAVDRRGAIPAAYPFKRSIHIWKRPSVAEIEKYLLEEPVDIVLEVRVERLLYDGNLK